MSALKLISSSLGGSNFQNVTKFTNLEISPRSNLHHVDKLSNYALHAFWSILQAFCEILMRLNKVEISKILAKIFRGIKNFFLLHYAYRFQGSNRFFTILCYMWAPFQPVLRSNSWILMGIKIEYRFSDLAMLSGHYIACLTSNRHENTLIRKNIIRSTRNIGGNCSILFTFPIQGQSSFFVFSGYFSTFAILESTTDQYCRPPLITKGEFFEMLCSP